MVAAGKKGFVVETHSDYILDRVRIEVAKGNIPAKDVSILFLEKTGIETKVHQIEVNDQGDVVDPPESYRQFFLEEGLSLLRRAL